MEIINRAVLTCPHCGYQYEKTMPDDQCVFFEECPNCHTVYRPKEGDCCVFCSYGNVPCPPIQRARLAQQQPS
jgi:rubredoxin